MLSEVKEKMCKANGNWYRYVKSIYIHENQCIFMWALVVSNALIIKCTLFNFIIIIIYKHGNMKLLLRKFIIMRHRIFNVGKLSSIWEIKSTRSSILLGSLISLLWWQRLHYESGITKSF